MQFRWMRALALASVLALGWSGMAAAQSPPPTGTYNFTATTAGTFFNPGGLNASGEITVGAGGAVTSIKNFVVNGVTQYLNTNGALFGGQTPTLNSTTSGNIFVGAPASNLFAVSTTPTSNVGYIFFNSFGVDYSQACNNGCSNGVPIDSDSLAAVAAPAPGMGLLSWVLAALALGSFGVWAQLRKHGAAAAVAFGAAA